MTDPRTEAGYDDVDYEYVDDLLEAADDVGADEDPDDVDPGPFCSGCGCSQLRACPGGCVWATPQLCSRCV